jgi:hypothetical protein
MILFLVLVVIVIIVIVYFYQKGKNKQLFAVNTAPVTNDNNIYLHNATTVDVYIDAYTSKDTGIVEKLDYVGQIPKLGYKTIPLYTKQLLEPDQFITISGIINKKLNLSFYLTPRIGKKYPFLRGYTYKQMYNIGKPNIKAGYKLALDIFDTTGVLKMYNKGIK